MSVDHYTYRVTWSAEDGEHVGLCTEFPSLSWLAKTPEAALKGIRQVVAEAVADMQASGETVPVPPGGKTLQRRIPRAHSARGPPLARHAGRRAGRQPEPPGECKAGGLTSPT
ncbi:MAG: hypothetical protein M5R42_15155 [Rhodocyclaceae bacterium]|nr:hypothetical protein [Rhodocyclaceae bacterium]